MEKIKIQFCPELQDVLLGGAVVVWHKIDDLTATILVKLPKGSFYKSENGFEYQFLQYDAMGEGSNMMYHSTSRNGSRIGCIKLASQEHTQRRLHEKRVRVLNAIL